MTIKQEKKEEAQQYEKVTGKGTGSKSTDVNVKPKNKIYLVTQHDLKTGQKVKAGAFTDESKAKDYCSGLDTTDNNYLIEEVEVE